MPGTGHSARYKSCISNRVKISPFEQLAKWNQDLLGADGMIPSITGGGGSLEFKKLNASDIDGVMTNPANLSIPSGGSLDMSCLSITDVSNVSFCPNGCIGIPRGSGSASFQQDELIISNNNVNGNVAIRGKPLKLSSFGLSSTSNHVDLILDSAVPTSSTNNIELKAEGANTYNGKIFIGFQSNPSAPSLSTRTITIGHNASSHTGMQTINIGATGTAKDNIRIGNTRPNTNTIINGGMGGTTTNLGLKLESKEIWIGTAETIGAKEVSIGWGSQAAAGQPQPNVSKIGFFGVDPVERPTITKFVTTSFTGAVGETRILAESINYLLGILDEHVGGGGGGLPAGLGLIYNGGHTAAVSGVPPASASLGPIP